MKQLPDVMISVKATENDFFVELVTLEESEPVDVMRALLCGLAQLFDEFDTDADRYTAYIADMTKRLIEEGDDSEKVVPLFGKPLGGGQ